MVNPASDEYGTGRGQAAQDELPPVFIPGTKQRMMRAKSNGRTYRIMTFVPEAQAPAAGFPVLYLLDANALFGSTVEAMRIQSRRSEKTGVVPAVIVGIGYDSEEPFPANRIYDFTIPVAETDLPVRPDGSDWPEHGGAEAFLAFINEELQPAVERDYPIDRSRQGIFGHSLGGLFVLHALFSRPDAFQTYIAGSPSIHWNRPKLLELEEQFSASLKRNHRSLQVLIGAGELEKGPAFRMMCEHAKEMADRLSRLTDSGLHTKWIEFAGDGHVSLLPALISRSLRFMSRSSL